MAQKPSVSEENIEQNAVKSHENEEICPVFEAISPILLVFCMKNDLFRSKTAKRGPEKAPIGQSLLLGDELLLSLQDGELLP